MPFDPDAYLAKSKTPFNPDAYLGAAAVPEVAPESNWLGEVLRQAGLSARAGVEGVGDTLDFLASPIRAATGIEGRTGQAVSDLVGLPKPEGDMEMLANKTASSMAGAMVPMAGAAKMLNTGISGAQRQIMELLASNPKAQALLSGLSGGSAEMVRQQGGGDLAQMGAAIGAPLAAAVAQPTIAGGLRTAKNILTAPTNRGARLAAGRLAVDAAGDKAPSILAAIRAGAEPETAAQAAMPAGSAEFAGLERLVRSRAPSAYGPTGTIARGAENWQRGQRDALNAAEDIVRTQLLGQADTAGLSAAPMSMEVARLKAQPGYKDVTSRQILDWIDKELVARADKGTADMAGVDLNDLRRDLGNKIKQKVADPKKPWDKAKAANLLRKFQLDIDGEIEQAVGNDRWSQELMKPSSQRRGELAAIQNRVAETEAMGSFGAPEAQRITRLDEEPFRLPNLLSRPMMAANAVLRFAQGKGGEKTSRTLANLMQPHEKMGLVKLMDEELKRRAARTPMGSLVKRAGVAGAMESEQITSE